MSAASSWDFFIAHAGNDKASAESLFDLMTGASRVFLDSRCLELGDDWDAKLATAQGSSLVTVVLVSSTTERAYYEREEIAAAIALAREAEQRHRVVPLYLDGDSKFVPYGLRLKHGLRISDTFTLSDAARELLALLVRLRASLSGPGASTSLDAAAPARATAELGILHQPPETWLSPVRRNPLRYKVAAFDMDGTLLRGDGFEFSWEAVWRGLAFGKDIQNQFRREYRQRTKSDASRNVRIKAYQDWCDRACLHFKSRGLTRAQLKEISEPLRLTVNCREALAELRKRDVVVAIISGGINTFLEDKFVDYRDFVDFVFINEMVFTTSGALDAVRATPFDFEGKAEALDIICKRVGCTPAEAVFVGDHFNDEAIMLKVDKAIAYPPQDAAVEGASHEMIFEDNLMTVIPHILVE